MEKHGTNIRKIVVSVIALIILAVVIFFVMLFDNSSYSAKSYEFSADVLNKVISAQKGGGTVEINADELNEALSPAFKKNKTVGSITVKGMNADITDNALKFYAPITYKGFNFLMTTEGKVYLKDKNIVYEPDYFELGKIKIPESYVLKKLNGKFNGMLKTQDNTLSIDANRVPVSMKSIEIKDSKLVINIETGQGSLNNLGSISAGDKQKVISNIKSAINNHDETSISHMQAEYNKLSPEQKAEVQSAISSSLDENTKNELMKKLH
ncbi:hypothetical protein J2Z42_000887 [Clostridium algifaecis]|uniref:Adhesin domain-containing protein n=1 Tax=Clostridium algifaecis TaxID=1472040 RepID=A0ABS4KQ94_9CLOT|nr:hypothetical protein [Clostridium algifaecis]MBP2032222.1 hypothetical protein [Clostridium algifaecis]